MEIGVIIGRKRALKLAQELTEAFSDESKTHIDVPLYAKNNLATNDDADVTFTMEPEWADEEQVYVEVRP